VLGVSEPYSSDIRARKRIPHPRHWEALPTWRAFQRFYERRAVRLSDDGGSDPLVVGDFKQLHNHLTVRNAVP